MVDSYYTLAQAGESYINEQRSRFYGYAHPVRTIEEAMEWVAHYRKKYYDARHVCWAYRLGKEGEVYRVNDDGEPSATAGKPIHGQMLSKEVSDLVVIVIRYFGGVKLGTSGLIEAYRLSAALAIDEAGRREVVAREVVELNFGYELMGEVMYLVKESTAEILEQEFLEHCHLKLAIRQNDWPLLEGQLSRLYQLEIKSLGVEEL